MRDFKNIDVYTYISISKTNTEHAMNLKDIKDWGSMGSFRVRRAKKEIR